MANADGENSVIRWEAASVATGRRLIEEVEEGSNKVETDDSQPAKQEEIIQAWAEMMTRSRRGKCVLPLNTAGRSQTNLNLAKLSRSPEPNNLWKPSK